MKDVDTYEAKINVVVSLQFSFSFLLGFLPIFAFEIWVAYPYPRTPPQTVTNETNFESERHISGRPSLLQLKKNCKDEYQNSQQSFHHPTRSSTRKMTECVKNVIECIILDIPNPPRRIKAYQMVVPASSIGFQMNSWKCGRVYNNCHVKNRLAATDAWTK